MCVHFVNEALKLIKWKTVASFPGHVGGVTWSGNVASGNRKTLAKRLLTKWDWDTED